MTNIEDKFYKTFKIPQKFYTTINFGDLDNNYQEVSANSLEELFENYSSYFDEYIEDIKDFMDWRSGYEDITSDIVLGLEEVILTETSHISHVQKYGYPILDKKNKKRIGTDWNYIYVVEVYVGCDELDCQNYDRYEGRGKTRIEALLKLCIKLKDEISEEVRDLFK